jgi:photosystem II stability/assembly factor-like uncharacterized protein
VKKIVLLIGLFCGVVFLLSHVSKLRREHESEEASSDLHHKLFPRENEDEEGGDELEAREHKSDHPDQFSVFNRAIRTREGAIGPEYQPGFLMRELNQAPKASQRLNKSNGARTQSSDGVLAWTERGPGNVPGRTIALLDLPGDANHNTWLVGAATGGIWKTTNGGNKWTEKSQSFSVLPISSLAMSTSNTSIVYAGTGEYVSTVTTAIGDGIFKSGDQGETWTQLSFTAGNPDFMVVTRIIVDPNNVNTLLASCVPPEYVTGKMSTIQRSTDGGTTWTKVYESTSAIEQIVSTPGNFNILYGAQHGTGTIKSTDGGNTWALSNAGMTPDGRVEISVSPVKTNRIFASTEGTLSGTGSDLYMSDDAGATWSLVNVSISDTTVDFLGGQGYYDNTIACDPFKQDVVYFGGVSYFQTTLTSGSTSIPNYTLDESQTSDFITLVNFDAAYGNGELALGTTNPTASVEIRFGPGMSQKAHRFLVPSGATSGVAATSYAYQDYLDVNFEVWDVTNNQQLMVSFRDQGRDSTFNLIDENTTSAVATAQSREYIFVNNVAYNPSSPNSNIAKAGGETYNEMYNIWPVLATGATWPPDQNVTLSINYALIQDLNATTITVADAYSSWDGKNKSQQVDLTTGVHPDHHGTAIIPIDLTAKTYKFLLGNDGGVFVSDISGSPGTTDGDIRFAGYGYNTSQFYAADKNPGADQYIGGMQDNGTRFSPTGETASASTSYSYAIGADGFEALWHNLDPTKLLGSYYYNNLFRSTSSGQNWSSATSGMTGAGSSTYFPFFSKLANSKRFPDRVFSVGVGGVYVSQNFGSSWTLTPITSNFSGASFFADVKVSQSNANIVWAGNGMSATSNLFISTDGGKSFHATPNYTLTTLGQLTKFATHPTKDSTAYALFSFSDSPKILRTTNLGQSWEDISGFGTNTSSDNGFPDVAVFCLYVRPDNPDIIWAGTEIGIVESLDNGNSWAILDDFPHVAVWDMKGQDNQVVIATHGRGIWTATIGTTQMYNKNPVILATGTSPQSQFVLKVHLQDAYDSTQVLVNSGVIGTLPKSDTGTYIIKISNVSVGSVQANLISYLGGAPIASASVTTYNLRLKAYQQQYNNFFNGATDFYTPKFSIQSFGASNTSLQTAHPYDLNTDITATLLQPIILTAQLPYFFYRSVAIVANDGDYVVAEGTKDGLTWIPIESVYDASANSDWLAAYQAKQSGTQSMEINRNIDLVPTFSATDTLLFRFRLHSNTTRNAWGWSIDDLYIQQVPTGLENIYSGAPDFTIFPNPTQGPFSIQYNISAMSPVSVLVYDFNGRVIGNYELGVRPEGQFTEQLPASLKAGVYFVNVKTSMGQKTKKLIVN